MRNNGAKFKVIKNRLTKLALEQTKFRHLIDLFKGPTAIGRPKAKHEKFKYRLIIWFERTFLCGKVLGGYKNYLLIKG